MTRDETKKIIMIISATYPNFKSENLTATVDAWNIFLQEYEYETIVSALKIYVATSTTGFAPSVSQLISMTNKPSELSELSESEAWSLVSKAIRNSGYNSRTEFERLPESVRKAVGSANQLYLWATDPDYNESVNMSLFQKNYRSVLNREKEIRSLPVEVRTLIENTSRQLIGVNE